MKTSDSHQQTHVSNTHSDQPFFGAKSEQAFFSKERSHPKPFFNPSSIPIQAKLTVGAANDQYEQEADRVAFQVVNQINSPSVQQGGDRSSVQRMGKEDDELQMKPYLQREAEPEENELQMEPIADQIQRVELPQEEELQMKSVLQRETDPEEEDELQMKPAIAPQATTQGGRASPDLESSIQQARGSGQPIAETVRSPLEQAFGADFSGVRVHTDAKSDQLNQSLQAKAFTTGQDVFFRQGAYEPGSRGGQELIAHELTHVVQQKRALSQGVQSVNDRSEMIRRDILPGQPIPAIETLTKKRFAKLPGASAGPEFEAQLLHYAKEHVRDRSFMLDVFADASIGSGTDQGDQTDLIMIEVVLTQALVDAPAISAARILAGNKLTELERVYGDSHHTFRMKLLIMFFKKNRESVAEGKEFLANRQNVSLAHGDLDRQSREDFAKALKKMPTIRYLLKVGIAPRRGSKKSEWQDGGSLREKINYVPQTGISSVREDQVDKNGIEDAVTRADFFIRGIVEPDLLGLLPKPAINIRLKKAQAYTAPLGFRAFQNANQVNVAYNDPVSVIVHEIGHYLEDRLPSEIWHDIQLLLRKRHDEVGGGVAGFGDFPAPDEGRYKGKYRATGAYTSRAYTSGSTEVMSMTLEFLSDPERALIMIEKDPLQAAIVLRGLRPQEYAATFALRRFDQFLPN